MTARFAFGARYAFGDGVRVDVILLAAVLTDDF